MKNVGIPLILTFKLDEVSQSRLDAWRSTYFPGARHHLRAHLTIYHQLPGQRLQDITAKLAIFAQEPSRTMRTLEFSSLKTRGGFVGITIEAPELLAIRRELDQLFSEYLRAQDQRPYQPHVTVTNLGSPAAAQSCLTALAKDFKPWTAQALGLELFHYRHGPWEPAGAFTFAAGE